MVVLVLPARFSDLPFAPSLQEATAIEMLSQTTAHSENKVLLCIPSEKTEGLYMT